MALILQRWLFPARVVRVIDADTVEVFFDAGFHNYRQDSIRLDHCWAPERNTPAGKFYTQVLRTIIADLAAASPGEYPFVLESIKAKNERQAETLGRYVGILWTPDGTTSVNEKLRQSGIPATKADQDRAIFAEVDGKYVVQLAVPTQSPPTTSQLPS